MKLLYQLLKQKITRWYYFPEFKQITQLFLIIFFGWLLYSYGEKSVKYLLSFEGLTYLVFFFVAILLAISIKLYYRIIVIKYHEKDTNIQLFKHVNKTTKLIILMALLGMGHAVQAQHANHMAAPTKGDYATKVNNGSIAKDTMKGSPNRVAMTSIGGTHIHIEYGSPGVKGRVIWGGLVAYDQVWSAGAHQATSIEFYKDVVIQGKKVKAGKYGFFAIPGKKQWTLILNKRWNQHLADEYDAKEDILRLNVTPQPLQKMVQRLTYNVEKKSDKSGMVLLSWEKISVALPFLVG